MNEFKDISDLLISINEKMKLSWVEKDILTIPEASLYTGLSDSTLHKLTSKRKIKHYKPAGKNIFFLKSDLNNWLLSNPVEPE